MDHAISPDEVFVVGRFIPLYLEAAYMETTVEAAG
jgi:hypothetical protein